MNNSDHWYKVYVAIMFIGVFINMSLMRKDTLKLETRLDAIAPVKS